jgi:hypothetical protein
VTETFSDEEEGWFHGSFAGEGEDLIFVYAVLVTRNRDSQVGGLVILRYQPIINSKGLTGTYCIHRLAAAGPNHSPGAFAQEISPCLTNLCIENGACGSSANQDNISTCLISISPRFIRQSTASVPTPKPTRREKGACRYLDRDAAWKEH